MGNAVSAGRPQITIVNGTRRPVWVAVYKRASLDEVPIAWLVVSSPPRGRTAVFIPQDHQVCARYSFEPENPRRPVHQTNCLQVLHAPAGAGFVIEGLSSPDRRTWGAMLTRAAKSPGWNQIRIVNRFSISVWSHVRQDGRDIFPPRVVPPMASLIEDLASPFYVAVLPLPRRTGDLLPHSEIVLTEIAVRPGESIRIQGGPYKGFRISRILEGDSKPDPGVATDTQAPRASQKKAKVQTSPKPGAEKRDAAKKPAKKMAKESVGRRRGQEPPHIDATADSPVRPD